jgi:glycosyltransferase involved in cell wall biosynthesis
VFATSTAFPFTASLQNFAGVNLEFMISPTKLPVSICLIAGNEATSIRRTLASVAGWSSEIIVVINEDVNDGTDKIAAEFGAIIFREPWKGFGPQKNSAVTKATQDWLLNLDADEEVSPALSAEIQSAIRDPGTHAAFCFPRITQFCGRWIRHGDWYPDRQTRLWRRGQVRWSDAPVHESPQVNGTVGRLRAELRHNLSRNIDRQIIKISAYTEAYARAAEAQNREVGGFDLFMRPLWRFVRGYFFRLGFLDGWQGVYIAWMTAFYTATRYAKIRAAQEQQNSPG